MPSLCNWSTAYCLCSRSISVFNKSNQIHLEVGFFFDIFKCLLYSNSSPVVFILISQNTHNLNLCCYLSVDLCLFFFVLFNLYIDL